MIASGTSTDYVSKDQIRKVVKLGSLRKDPRDHPIDGLIPKDMFAHCDPRDVFAVALEYKCPIAICSEHAGARKAKANGVWLGHTMIPDFDPDAYDNTVVEYCDECHQRLYEHASGLVQDVIDMTHIDPKDWNLADVVRANKFSERIMLEVSADYGFQMTQEQAEKLHVYQAIH